MNVDEIIEYGELEDALGWIAEAPTRADTDTTGTEILRAAAVHLGVDYESLDEFTVLGLTRVLSGSYGLNVDVLEHLIAQHDRNLCMLIGIAAARGKVGGP